MSFKKILCYKSKENTAKNKNNINATKSIGIKNITKSTIENINKETASKRAMILVSKGFCSLFVYFVKTILTKFLQKY